MTPATTSILVQLINQPSEPPDSQEFSIPRHPSEKPRTRSARTNPPPYRRLFIAAATIPSRAAPTVRIACSCVCVCATFARNPCIVTTAAAAAATAFIPTPHARFTIRGCLVVRPGSLAPDDKTSPRSDIIAALRAYLLPVRARFSPHLTLFPSLSLSLSLAVRVHEGACDQVRRARKPRRMKYGRLESCETSAARRCACVFFSPFHCDEFQRRRTVNFSRGCNLGAVVARFIGAKCVRAIFFLSTGKGVFFFMNCAMLRFLIDGGRGPSV